MDRMSIFLLALDFLVFSCGGHDTNSREAEQAAEMDELHSVLNVAGIEPIELRNHLSPTEDEENVVQKEAQLVDQLLLDDTQSRSFKDVSISTNSNSANARFPRDCADVMRSGEQTSGVYTVYIGPLKRSVSVYCDMSTEAGGWTVFQRRKDGRVKFERPWGEYAAGFGDVAGEFWLGNDIIHLLTKIQKYRLRVDLHDWNGTSRYAEYHDFKVSSACDKYKLVSVGTYCGNAGDSMAYHVGQKFSTLDQDNDAWDKSCAVVYKGAWWYGACYYSNLNGLYYLDARSPNNDGISWYHLANNHNSLKFVEMKIRPTDI